MRRWIAIAAATGAIVGAFALGARALDTPDPSSDIGTNERLLFVVAGRFATLEAARAANEEITVGELQGFYVVPSASLEGNAPGEWLLATAFRTERGAAEFEELARAAGVEATERITVRYLGTAFVGLGQEPHPDGSGPLIGPLPAGHANRL